MMAIKARIVVVAALLGLALLGVPAWVVAAEPAVAATAASAAVAMPDAASAPAASTTAASAAASAAMAAAPASAAGSGLATAGGRSLLPGKGEQLQIADPYIELRSGPGRGYPVFFVASRHAWIEIELRHTDWFRVRTEGGRVGWVNRGQLEATLTASGSRKSFRDILVDDFLSRRVQVGASWGHFKGEPMLKVWGNVRTSETLSLEATYGQVQGVFSGTDFWHLDIVAEPWSDRSLTPFVAIGVGRFSNFPNLSLVNATTTNAKMANASVGVRYHLSDRFLVRADYTLYTVFVADQRTTEYRAWTGGLAFFF